MDAEPTVNAQDGTEVEEKSNVAVTAEQLVFCSAPFVCRA